MAARVAPSISSRTRRDVGEWAGRSLESSLAARSSRRKRPAHSPCALLFSIRSASHAVCSGRSTPIVVRQRANRPATRPRAAPRKSSGERRRPNAGTRPSARSVCRSRRNRSSRRERAIRQHASVPAGTLASANPIPPAAASPARPPPLLARLAASRPSSVAAHHAPTPSAASGESLPVRRRAAAKAPKAAPPSSPAPNNNKKASGATSSKNSGARRGGRGGKSPCVTTARVSSKTFRNSATSRVRAKAQRSAAGVPGWTARGWNSAQPPAVSSSKKFALIHRPIKAGRALGTPTASSSAPAPSSSRHAVRADGGKRRGRARRGAAGGSTAAGS